MWGPEGWGWPVLYWLLFMLIMVLGVVSA